MSYNIAASFDQCQDSFSFAIWIVPLLDPLNLDGRIRSDGSDASGKGVDPGDHTRKRIRGSIPDHPNLARPARDHPHQESGLVSPTVVRANVSRQASVRASAHKRHVGVVRGNLRDKIAAPAVSEDDIVPRFRILPDDELSPPRWRVLDLLNDDPGKHLLYPLNRSMPLVGPSRIADRSVVEHCHSQWLFGWFAAQFLNDHWSPREANDERHRYEPHLHPTHLNPPSRSSPVLVIMKHKNDDGQVRLTNRPPELEQLSKLTAVLHGRWLPPPTRNPVQPQSYYPPTAKHSTPGDGEDSNASPQ